MIYLYKKHKAKKEALNIAKEQQASESKPDSNQPEDVNTPEKQLDSQPEISAETADAAKVVKSQAPTETPEEKRRRRIYRWKLVIALFPPAFLAAVDTTIVATALTTIASHFSMFSSHISVLHINKSL
jgi:hypothetical protein